METKLEAKSLIVHEREADTIEFDISQLDIYSLNDLIKPLPSVEIG